MLKLYTYEYVRCKYIHADMHSHANTYYLSMVRNNISPLLDVASSKCVLSFTHTHVCILCYMEYHIIPL